MFCAHFFSIAQQLRDFAGARRKSTALRQTLALRAQFLWLARFKVERLQFVQVIAKQLQPGVAVLYARRRAVQFGAQCG